MREKKKVPVSFKFIMSRGIPREMTEAREISRTRDAKAQAKERVKGLAESIRRTKAEQEKVV